MTKQNIPKIRFNNYTDAWEQHKLGEVADVRDGTHDSPKYINDGYPLLTSKNVGNGYINYDDTKCISEKDYIQINKRSKVDVNDILMGMIGTIGNLALIRKEPDFAIKNVALIKHTINFDYQFLFQELQTNSISKELLSGMDGGTQKFIPLKKIRDLSILLPTKNEQGHIGSFFQSLDSLIALHQRKLEELKSFKATMLSKVFPKHGQTVPEIRLAGFDGEWEKTKLRDVSERVQGNDGRMDLPTLTISAAQGWLSQKDRFSQNIAGKEQKNYTLLKRGELSYNHGNSKLAKYGVVFELNNYEEALVPRVYHSFKVNELANPRFIETMFATKQPDRELRKLVSSGARMDGLLNINYDDFMGISIIIPTVHEQETIGEFFSNLDNLISETQSKIEELETLKKKLLREMFI
ncbi:type I restriction modification DNA specificity domain protein [Streptococcus downei F0415]|uniref:restriction endonuclease subunit S n=1 Tax=Streptococcus downei TaxID=1317 RepID=UPI0001E994D9|nr:restriction endonuclease subunit S [Streptococcus downei]EFQ57600.1 type I restriction modification DNA specificity domain protein [Streptococcus downei F0415]